MTLEEKVNYLEQVVINHDPISRIALIYNLDPNQIENIYQIFEKYFNMCNNNQSFTYSDVEADFIKQMNIDYQSLKGIILAFSDAGKYENVFWQYLKTNFQSHGNVSSEYNELFNRLKSRYNS